MASEAPWPMDCGTCRKKVKDEESAQAIFRCRQGHFWATCNEECQRQFAKKCDKVGDSIDKLERKLNNEGQMNALRRLPATEREKLKQKEEALKKGWLICPLEVKASDRSVPFCAYCMTKVGGVEDSQKQEEGDLSIAPPPPPRSKQPPPPNPADMALVDESMLVVLKKDDDGAGDDLEEAAPKPKKKGKQGKQKKGKELLLLDCYDQYRQTELEGDASPNVQAKSGTVSGSPQTARSNNGISAWALGRPDFVQAAAKSPTSTPMQQQRAADQQKIQQLIEMGCSSEKAKALLEAHGWQVMAAAEAFLDEGSGEAAPVDVSIPRWGQKRNSDASQAEQAQEEVQPQEEAAQAQPVAAMEEAPAQEQDSVPAPPPSEQPPPPNLPPGWRPVWCEEQSAYYYWHVPTNHSTWDLPAGAEDEATVKRRQQMQSAAEVLPDEPDEREDWERDLAEAQLEAQRAAEEERKALEEEQRAAEEAQRLAAEAAAAAAEAERIAEAQRLAEAQRAAAEAQRKREEEAQRKREEEEKARQRAEEEKRRAEEQRRLEEQRKAEEQRKEEQRKAEEQRAAEQRAAEQRAAQQRAAQAATERQRAAEQKAAEQKAAAQKAAALDEDARVEKICQITGVDRALARARYEAEGWDVERAVRVISAECEFQRRFQASKSATVKAEPDPHAARWSGPRPWLRICTRHWTPLPTLNNTMKLNQGERVQVTWTDGKEGGWAYGSTLEDPSIEGYFPQDILAEPEREAHPRNVGEAYGVIQRFDAPEDIAGYLSVLVGETVQVLHPLEKPYVWAYVRRISDGSAHDPSAPNCGWVPEAVLGAENAVQPAG